MQTLESSQRPRLAIFCDDASLKYQSCQLSLTYPLADHFDIDVYVTRGRDLYSETFDKLPFHHFDFRRDSIDFLSQFARGGRGGYEHLIAIDPYGLRLCNALFPDGRPVYYSGELFPVSDTFHIWARDGSREIPWIEQQLLPKTSGTIIQSDTRMRIFEEIHKDYDQPIFIMPLVRKADAARCKSDFCHREFGIPESLKVLIHMGLPYLDLEIEKVMEAIQKIPGWCFLIHGRPGMAHRDLFETMAVERKMERIYFTNTFFDREEEGDELLSGVDAGYAWLRPDHMINREAAGFSCGRIVNYFRNGIPVVTNAGGDFREAVEVTGGGRCIDNHNELKQTLFEMEKRLELMSQNALREFNHRYRYQNYEKALRSFLDDLRLKVDEHGQPTNTLQSIALSSLLGEKIEKVIERSTGRNCYLWGAGSSGRMMGQLLVEYGFQGFSYLDSQASKQGSELQGKPVLDPESVLYSSQKPLIFITSEASHKIGFLLRTLGYKAREDFYFLYP